MSTAAGGGVSCGLHKRVSTVRVHSKIQCLMHKTMPLQRTWQGILRFIGTSQASGSLQDTWDSGSPSHGAARSLMQVAAAAVARLRWHRREGSWHLRDAHPHPPRKHLRLLRGPKPPRRGNCSVSFARHEVKSRPQRLQRGRAETWPHRHPRTHGWLTAFPLTPPSIH